MSTFIQLTVEVTTGDDLALEQVKPGDSLGIVVREPTQGDRGDKVKATLHSWAYVAEENLP